jgi:catechol 2,3-dioxygenase-like lactoylglutathione lyase family enzyme
MRVRGRRAEDAVAKIRHIAYRSQDVEALAKFFVDGLGLDLVQRRGNGAIDLSDGSLNITLLPMSRPRADGTMPTPGIEHIGFTVTDEPAARERLVAAGAQELAHVDLGPVNYEVKFHGPEDIEVDLGLWAGAAPVEEESLAAR